MGIILPVITLAFKELQTKYDTRHYGKVPPCKPSIPPRAGGAIQTTRKLCGSKAPTAIVKPGSPAKEVTEG
jgi:hypothetical protein